MIFAARSTAINSAAMRLGESRRRGRGERGTALVTGLLDGVGRVRMRRGAVDDLAAPSMGGQGVCSG